MKKDSVSKWALLDNIQFNGFNAWNNGERGNKGYSRFLKYIFSLLINQMIIFQITWLVNKISEKKWSVCYNFPESMVMSSDTLFCQTNRPKT